MSSTFFFKSLKSCPTLRDPIHSSPPGSPVPGILQARTLEWVAISLGLKNIFDKDKIPRQFLCRSFFYIRCAGYFSSLQVLFLPESNSSHLVSSLDVLGSRKVVELYQLPRHRVQRS